MLSRITFPKQMLTRFLNRLIEGDFSDMVDRLNADNSRRKFPYSKIPYGIDEFFINTSIYNYLISHNIEVFVRKNYFMGLNSFLFYSGKLTAEEMNTIKLSYEIDMSEKLVEKIKKILRKYKEYITSQRLVYHEVYPLLNSFKTSFVKTYVLEGKELE